jgi:tRNA(adenine34) deaminase
VGAVVVTNSGAIVARGRSRFRETVAPSGQLAGSRIAHAEINSLGALPSADRRHETLYTTLQPCFACTAAIVMSRIGVVRFAGRDPVWDCLDGIPGSHPLLAVRWYRQDGPLEGPVAAWAALFPVLDLLERSPDEAPAVAFRVNEPGLVRFAQQLLVDRQVRELRRLPLGEAMSQLWGDLIAFSG